MTSTAADVLEQLDRLLQEVCTSAEMQAQFAESSGPGLVAMLQGAGRVQRLLDAVVTTVVGAVQDRDMRPADERVSPAAGCRDATELLRRTLRIDAQGARRYASAARALHRDVQLSTGEPIPARFEALGEALRDGEVSVTGPLAAVTPIDRAGNRISIGERSAADRILADAARGLDLPDAAGRPGPAPTTDELGALAQHLLLALDPDGKEPEDQVAMRKRGLPLGAIHDGIVPISGGLLPDVAGQLQRLYDALLNPRVEAPPVASPRFVDDDDEQADPSDPDALPDPIDDRTPAQKRHDAFAAILSAAAAPGGMPDLGGAAPTLVVSVTAADYLSGIGRAHIQGTGWDTPIAVVRHTACAGGIQRVPFDDHGQILSIGTTARIFTAIQRRAIIFRDQECVIPGCHTPATWCEIHHVREWADGGPTHTSNGVALCWFHHRTLDTSGWRIRMARGVPEIRGPHWWDPHGAWHPPRHRGGFARVRRALAEALAPPGG